MEQRHETIEVENQREAALTDEHDEIEDYRPFATQKYSLVALIVLNSCLIILMMVVRHLLSIRPRAYITAFIEYTWAFTTAPALLYACFWLAVDFNVIRMEPVYQYAESQEDQRGLHDSLAFSYVACNALTIPLHAFKRRHWTVFYSSLSHLIASIVLPTVVTEMAGPRVDRTQGGVKFHSRVHIQPVFFWITIGSLTTIAFLTGCLIRMLQDRRSGVKADPSSIVGLAITFADTDILDQLRLLKPDSLPESAGLRWLYRRQFNRTTRALFRYPSTEIIAQLPLLSQAASTSDTERKLHLSRLSVGRDSRSPHLSRVSRGSNKWSGLTVLFVLLFLITGVALGWFMPSANQWLYQNAYIVRPVLTLTGTLIKSLWTTIERGELNDTCRLGTIDRSYENH
jgi:hypothetical protein